MKKIIGVLMSLLLVLSIMPGVFAEEDTSDVEEITTDDVEVEELEGDAGISPDNALHGIDRALERIRMRMTFGAKNKAAYGLKVAEERLLELQAMGKAGNVGAMEKAKENHRKILEEIESNLEDVENDDPESEVEDYVDFEARLERHRERIAKLVNVVDLRVIGKLTDEQKAKIEALIADLEDDGNNVKIKLVGRKEKALLKFKAKSGKTDAEIKERLKEIEDEQDLDELKQEAIDKSVERLEKKIEKLSEIADNLEEKGKDVSLLKERLEDAKEIVNEIKGLEELDEARELIKEVNQLLNFRHVFWAAKTDEFKERLKELEEKREEKKEEIKEKLGELKEKRAERLEKLKERESRDEEEDE